MLAVRGDDCELKQFLRSALDAKGPAIRSVCRGGEPTSGIRDAKALHVCAPAVASNAADDSTVTAGRRIEHFKTGGQAQFHGHANETIIDQTTTIGMRAASLHTRCIMLC